MHPFATLTLAWCLFLAGCDKSPDAPHLEPTEELPESAPQPQQPPDTQVMAQPTSPSPDTSATKAPLDVPSPEDVDAGSVECNRWGPTCKVTVITPAVKAKLEAMDKREKMKLHFTEETTDAGLATLSEVPWVSRLEIEGAITSLAPLAGLQQLTELKVSVKHEDDEPLDISGLKDLDALVKVNFYGTRITGEAEGLQNKPALKELNLYMAYPREVGYVTEMKQLEVLDLYAAKEITDYTPLTGMTQLRDLNLYMSKAQDFSPLASLTGLEDVWLQFTSITDLEMLRGATGLKTLRASWCKGLVDISALEGKAYLEWLSLMDTQVRDLTPLVGATQLNTLDLSSTPVTDLSPLSELKGLKDLNLSKTAVDDLSPLEGLVGLTSLRISKSQVTDLTPLKGATSLKTLDINETQVSDLSPLSEMRQLRRLNASHTPVTDITPLLGLSELKRVKLPGSVPSDQIQALKKALPNVEVQQE